MVQEMTSVIRNQVSAVVLVWVRHVGWLLGYHCRALRSPCVLFQLAEQALLSLHVVANINKLYLTAPERSTEIWESQHVCSDCCGVVQIPAGRRSVLDAYGEIILRGWREAVGACLPEIESSLIQVRSHANTAVEFSLFRLPHARQSVLLGGWGLEQRRRRQICSVPNWRPTHAR